MLVERHHALNAGKVGSRLCCLSAWLRSTAADGEDPRLLNAVATWREKAALDWAERLTRGLPEVVGERAFCPHAGGLDAVEPTELTVAVALRTPGTVSGSRS